MRFIDRTSWWPVDGDPFRGHVSSPTFASGTAIADEFFYPLMMGWYKQGLTEFVTKLTDGVLDPTEAKLIELPKQFCSTAKRSWTMGEIVAPMMSAGLLPIALYRNRNSHSARYMLPYVLTNPPHATVLRNSDRIYVLIRESGSVAYTVSVKRLERASRSIQRYFRQMLHMRWQKKYLSESEPLESVLVSEQHAGLYSQPRRAVNSRAGHIARSTWPNPAGASRPRSKLGEGETLPGESLNSRANPPNASPLGPVHEAGAAARPGSAQTSPPAERPPMSIVDL
ncbi:hypothetical protein T492DRAFT_846363 [Pavlovales sp. CCMP2436]|nr:hypothetical protein T492DRAFT_846363 [Pavlovales sp. CCMP2436]